MTMDNFEHLESPMLIKISFNKLIEKYEELSKSEDTFIAARAKKIVEIQNHHPVLREGFSDLTLLETYKNEIQIILKDSFSEILTKNEIKAASIPFQNIVFNASERFKSIVNNAGKDFNLEIRNMPVNDIYIIACTVILNFYYGYDINLKRPLCYEIPDINGIKHYYKILYNADFMEIIPTEKAVKITENDYHELLDNYDNIELWKEKFPLNSYIFKGFVISNIFDVTDDQSISNIKSNLIVDDDCEGDSFISRFRDIFQSLFGIKDIQVGFSI
jgi:hypothetical protein